MPYARLRRQWQGPLLTLLRQTLQSATVHQLVETCCRKSPNGLGTNVQQGKDILASSGLPIIPANDLGDAAKKIVAEVKAPVAA